MVTNILVERVCKLVNRGKLIHFIISGFKVIKFTWYILFIILLNGCIPCYYAPNAQNVPLLKERGDVNASLGMKIGVYSIGCDVQGALAVSNHLGLMANYSYFSGRKQEIDFLGDDYKEHFKSPMIEFGFGYYKTFNDMFLVEAYSGAGLDWIKNQYDYFDGNGTSNLESACYFLQPAFGFYKKNVELAFSLRLRIVDYIKIQYDPVIDQSSMDDMIQIRANPVAVFLEPAFTFRAGGEQVKFQFQSGVSLNIGSTDVSYDPLNINLGLIFTLGGKKKGEAVQ